ncbi:MULTISPECIES: glycosyltransferase [Bradyrhizobium]|jgi:glycosyltransferase involved in cell wall biosynthesis|uniref:glycosyltransferase n=1 Tax=Bradyrhizobium TaxID=374 RepID=UPI000F9B15AD|nr:glycosyltransferase [Bradyrhizobium denitrificans]MCL8485460.1 glycosyltransferase [Bradyrhizobium denitrificans]RTM05577.1 MAG: glycosyltransferase [Bradyrhizobiaceae bacterium]
MPITFTIITPTFNRPTLLSRHLSRTIRQAYEGWQLLVVHDGPNADIRSLVYQYTTRDSRVSYLETNTRANDCGATPRLAGLNHLAASGIQSDYVVFWDDDNAYKKDALGQIAREIEKADMPELLVVGVRRNSTIIPPKGASIHSLQVGELDTSGLIFRPQLARRVYAQMLEQSNREDILRFNDFLSYKYARELLPTNKIKGATETVICNYDGLRWAPYLRSLLGLPPLGIAGRLRLGR